MRTLSTFRTQKTIEPIQLHRPQVRTVDDVRKTRYDTGKPKRPIYALSLDGVSGAVKANAAASINNLGTATIVAVVNPYSLGGGDLGRICAKDGATKTNLGLTSGPKIRFIQDFDNTDGDWRSPNTTFNNKHHIVITYDRTSVLNDPTIYINGLSVSVTENITPVGTAQDDSSKDLYISNVVANDRTFHGLIYSFAYFNVILTPTQVSNLSNNLVSPNQISGCVLYHDYTLGHAQDLSGNNNNGTIVGNAQFIITEVE